MGGYRMVLFIYVMIVKDVTRDYIGTVKEYCEKIYLHFLACR